MFTRDIANVVMDVNDVEEVSFDALGGADTITINDMSGTDVTRVAINLGVSGAGDGQADTIIINATNGDDVVLVTGENGTISVLGLATQIDIFNFEASNDRIIINTLGGDDVIEGSGLGAGMALIANGGDGNDILIGGEATTRSSAATGTMCWSEALAWTSSKAASATTSCSSSLAANRSTASANNTAAPAQTVRGGWSFMQAKANARRLVSGDAGSRRAGV